MDNRHAALYSKKIYLKTARFLDLIWAFNCCHILCYSTGAAFNSL